MILALKVALRTWGFVNTINWIRQHTEHVPEATPAHDREVRTAEQAVAMAGALYPGRALCLEQSLVLYYALRRQGVPVKYCQGVQPRPFQAHAWVEYRGEPINDQYDRVKHFARLPAQLP